MTDGAWVRDDEPRTLSGTGSGGRRPARASRAERSCGERAHGSPGRGLTAGGVHRRQQGGACGRADLPGPGPAQGCRSPRQPFTPPATVGAGRLVHGPAPAAAQDHPPVTAAKSSLRLSACVTCAFGRARGSISPILTALGGAPPMRTPTGSCASTSPTAHFPKGADLSRWSASVLTASTTRPSTDPAGNHRRQTNQFSQDRGLTFLLIQWSRASCGVAVGPAGPGAWRSRSSPAQRARRIAAGPMGPVQGRTASLGPRRGRLSPRRTPCSS